MSAKFGTLRYPNAQLERDSDFLEIKVVQYEPPGFDTNANQGVRLRSSSDSLKKNIETPLGSIFLPIPETIQDSNGVSWGEDSINGLAAAGAGAVLNTIQSDTFSEAGQNLVGGTENAIKSLGGDAGTGKLLNSFFASKALNVFGANTSLGGVLARSSGQILNPNMELLFNGVQLRSFNFDFDLAPRDEKESDIVKKIIRTLKKSMSAKSQAQGNNNTSGLFIKSPDVYQLVYKTGKDDHKFLHKFKPMALLNMSVNYTGAGTYATYDNTAPVHMKMNLSFQELNPVYAEDYDKGQGAEGTGF